MIQKKKKFIFYFFIHVTNTRPLIRSVNQNIISIGDHFKKLMTFITNYLIHIDKDNVIFKDTIMFITKEVCFRMNHKSDTIFFFSFGC